MDGNPADEPDGAAVPKAKRKGWPSVALQQDKKTVFWMGGVMECFSTVLSLFTKADLSPTKEDDWEVPFNELSEFMYLGAGAQGTVFRSSLRGEMVAVKHVRDKDETNIKHLRALNHENIVPDQAFYEEHTKATSDKSYSNEKKEEESQPGDFTNHYKHEKCNPSTSQRMDTSPCSSLQCQTSKLRGVKRMLSKSMVRFRGVSTNGPIPCIIMEFCQYGPLFEFLHSGALISAEQTFTWAKDIALGMAYLHSHKIIHRDLKSPNILIADNLLVKVSDFGTSRTWDDVSTIMSFTGTVAWMAPEVIRHEPCSERVDVWSYGIVLWELLTQEVPYKNLESHAIMWGVGTNTLSLPIPASCPGNLQTLLQQCWSRIPRNRPPFKIIAANLEVSGYQFAQLQGDCFSAAQITWRQEIKEGMKYIMRPSPTIEVVPVPQGASRREEDVQLARDARNIYEQQITRANELYMEVCAVRLQLEQREKEVAEREKALVACRCGIRKNLKYVQRQTSSSSDNMNANVVVHDRRRKKNDAPSHLVVNYLDKGQKTVSRAVSQESLSHVMKDVTSCVCSDTVDNNNLSTIKMKNAPVAMRDTTIKIKNMNIEPNGNVVKLSKKGLARNDNYIPPIAHV